MGVELAVAGLIISAVGTGASIAAQQDAKQDARKQKKIQEQQVTLQRRREEARARREARIRGASLAASGASAGITGSIIQAPQLGLESSVRGGLDLLNRQSDLNLKQIDISTDTAISQANANIARSVGSFASTALDFSSEIFPTDGA